MKSDLELTGDQVQALLDAGFEPTMEPQLIELREQSRKLGKGGEITLTLTGRTNVKNQALIDPDVLTVALFELLYELHGNDFSRFSSSCLKAINVVENSNNLKLAA